MKNDEWIDFTLASEEDKANLFGEEFRNISVIRACACAGGLLVEIILNGRKLTLVGDPQKALAVHLAGSEPGEVKQ